MLYPLSYCPVFLVEQPGFEPGTHVVPSAFAAKLFKIPLPAPAATIGGETCLLLYQLSYRTREGVTRTRTGNPQITCSSSCIRRRFPRWRQQLTRVSLAALWKRPRSGCRNPPNHVLPPAFASRILYKADKETTETFIVTGYIVPASIRPPNNLTGDNS